MTTVYTDDAPAGFTRIHCPACGGRDVRGQVIEKRETVKQGPITLSTHTTWWVDCSACKARLHSRVKGDRLLKGTADDHVGQVYVRVPLVKQFLAVASVLIAIFPIAGFGMGLVAWLLNRKSAGWPKTVSLVGFVLSSIFNALYLFLMVFAPKH